MFDNILNYFGYFKRPSLVALQTNNVSPTLDMFTVYCSKGCYSERVDAFSVDQARKMCLCGREMKVEYKELFMMRELPRREHLYATALKFSSLEDVDNIAIIAKQEHLKGNLIGPYEVRRSLMRDIGFDL